MKPLIRLAVTLEAGAGTVLLLRPGTLIDLTGASADRPTRRVLQVLGARQLLQALVIGLRPSPKRLAVGASIDVLHASSMVLAAAVLPGHRRLAALSAGQAGVCALLLSRSTDGPRAPALGG